MFTWVDGNMFHGIVTLYPSNFTLNNAAANFFEDIRWCCIGIDEKGKKIAIKPVTKREVDLNLIPMKQLNKVSIGKGYARISNKSVIDRISLLINQECSGLKFTAVFDDSEKMLIIDLNDPL